MECDVAQVVDGSIAPPSHLHVKRISSLEEIQRLEQQADAAEEEMAHQVDRSVIDSGINTCERCHHCGTGTLPLETGTTKGDTMTS